MGSERDGPVDATAVVDWLRVWWVEAALGGVAVVGLLGGLLDGDALTLVLGLAVLVAVADRLRLRLDNRSLAAAVDEVAESRVSAARRGATSVDGPTADAGARGDGVLDAPAERDVEADAEADAAAEAAAEGEADGADDDPAADDVSGRS